MNLEEEGIYGKSSRKKDITHNHNPLGLKLTTLPEEKICPMCDIKADIVFPINDVLLCLPCAEKMAERTDTKVSYKLYTNLKPEGQCAKCGIEVVVGVKASFHICHSCTVKLGKMEQARKMKEAANARKILDKYGIRKVI